MNTPKTRPYWHVDLKWVFGILAFLSLWGALLMNAFSTLTEKQNATTVTGSVVTSVVDSSGVDLTAAIDQLKSQATLLPDGAQVPIPNMPWLKITKEDLLSKTNEEIKSVAISQLTTPIYEQGLDKAAEQFTTNAADQQSFKRQAGLLGVISKQTHELLSLLSKILLGFSLVWFVGLIYFSAGWGRLASPGVVLMSVSPVGVAVGALLEVLSKKNDSLFSFLPQSVIQNLSLAINGTYRTAFFIGLGLLIVAGIGKLASGKLPKHQKEV